ncbi:MAG TPA: APC family permease, partial [Gemmatimonadales bacterium]|jgi:amino acid transporter
VPGFLAGVILWLTELASGAAVGTLLGSSVTALLGLSHSTWAAGAIITLTFATLAAINIRGIKTGSGTMEIVTAVKLIPLIAFVVVGAAFVSSANFTWGVTPDTGSVLRTSGILVFAFAGIEGALIPSGEVRAPARTVPRAALLGLGAVTLLYCGVHFVAQGVLGADLVTDKATPLASAAARFAGSPGRSVMLLAVVVSVLGHLSSAILAAPRAPFALARDGFLPASLAAVHERFHTPYVAIVLHTVLVIVLAVSGTFAQLAVLANISLLIVYFMCAISVWVLRRKDVKADGEPFRVWGGPVVPLLTCVATGWVIWATVTQREILAVLAALFVASLLYATRAWRTRAA